MVVVVAKNESYAKIKTADLVDGKPPGNPVDTYSGIEVVFVADATMSSNKIFLYVVDTWFEVTTNFRLF